MGLFSFFSKSPQKAEDSGDAYFKANNFGSAKLEYESALHIIEKKHPEDTALKERVAEKLRNSREALARQHLETATGLIEAKAVGEAEKYLSLALSLTEDPGLQQEIRSRAAQRVVEAPVDEISEDECVDDEDPDDDDDDECLVSDHEPRGERAEMEDDEEFDILCMTLPEEIETAYRSYGESFKEGFLALSRGDFALAEEKLRIAMDENPSPDSHIPLERATALLNMGQTGPAIDLLKSYLRNNPASFHGTTLLCDIHCDLKQFADAHGVIASSPDSLRKSAAVNRLDARIFFLEGNYGKAEEILRHLLDTSGWNTDISRELGLTLDAAGKTEEAKTLFANLLNRCTGCGQRINPLDKKAFADLSFKLNDFSDKILNLFLELASEHPEIRSDCYSKASLIYSSHGNTQEAARFRKLAEASA